MSKNNKRYEEKKQGLGVEIGIIHGQRVVSIFNSMTREGFSGNLRKKNLRNKE